MLSNGNGSFSNLQKSVILFCLIFAGEMIFSLPFHVARFFRPTFLSTFELSNAQLGDVFAFYGITAMLSYFPGGLIADRVSSRRLMSLSLFCTALGGIYLAQFPSLNGLRLLFGYWGVTTILMFWAAMIKVTREVGGDHLQGRAFGFLDGGRGLIAAAVASIAVFVLGESLPKDLSILTMTDRKLAIQQVIYFYSAATLLAAIMVWFLIPKSASANKATNDAIKENTLKGLQVVIKRGSFWWIAIVVICAYCGFKGVDNYALYATQVLSMNELEAAQFTSYIAYTRPFVAVVAGFIADRFLANRVALLSFFGMAGAYGLLSISDPASVGMGLLVANLVVSVSGVFAVRAIYFALLHEGQLPKRYTGTAVGIISVIGFTPDIFFAPIAGRILDASPGVSGHQDFFVLMTGIALGGAVSSLLLLRTIKR